MAVGDNLVADTGNLVTGPIFNHMNTISDLNIIKVLQHNLHKSKDATLDTIHWFDQLKGRTGIALLQEPHNIKGKISNLKNTLKYCTDTSGKNCRAAIITTNNINWWRLDQFCTVDQATVAIKTKQNTITVFSSIYMPFDSIDPPPSTTTSELVAFCEENNWDLIVGADANSHNQVWGSSDNNQRGEKLLEYIVSTNMQICNEGNTPTFENAIRKEVIDITLAANRTVDRVQNWKVQRNVSTSDHNRITFNFIQKLNHSKTRFRNIKRTNWEHYRTGLQQALPDKETFLANRDLDRKAEQIEEAINKAFEKSCHHSTNKGKLKPKWWNRELETLKRKTLKLRRQYRNEPTEEKNQAWKEVSTKYKREIRKAQSVSWEQFCNELKDETAISKLQKLMKQDRKYEPGTLKLPNGDYTKTMEETLEELMRVLYPDKETQSSQEEEEIQWNEDKIDINKMINKQSVEAAFKSFKPYKSPGPDNVYPALIQQGLPALLPYLIDLYKNSMRDERPAVTWLKTKAVFIPKPGKKDYREAKSFRPISLSSFILKGLERIIHWELTDTTLKEKPLSKNLYSYQEGISTENALHRVISKIEKSLEENKTTIIIFLDISGAFSDASIAGLKKSLANRGVKKDIGTWITYMLENRKVSATIGDSNTTKEINRGTPQGGILSPTIYNIDTDEVIIEINENSPNEAHGFADDLIDIGTGIDEATIASTLQKDLQRLEKWASRNSLTFNPNKTKAMIFTRRRNYTTPTLTIHGTPIEYVTEFKYLGVTIDNKLRWTKHIDNQTHKAQLALITGRRMIGKRWGLKPKQTEWLYKSIVRPILTYGSIVWANSMEIKCNRARLEKVQRTACLMITGTMRSTPTAGMEALLNITPIDIHIEGTAIAGYNRLQRTKSWRPVKGESLWKKGHTHYMNKRTKDFPQILMPQDNGVKKTREVAWYEIKIEDRETIEKTRPRPHTENIINCFTDGSKTEEATGAGFILMSSTFKEQNSLHLGPDATVFQAEITAIHNAITTLLQRKTENFHININVDSQAALKALNRYETKQVCVTECKQAINKLVSNNNKVVLKWIPGHEGHMGNEVADRLAKRGSELAVQGPTPFLPLGNTVIRTKIKSWEKKQHSERWSSRKDCRQTKMFLPELNRKWSKEIINQSKKNMRMIIQILTGHNNLRRHKFLMGIEPSAECENCGEEEETSEHFLLKCPFYSLERYQILGNDLLEAEDIRSMKLTKIRNFIGNTIAKRT
jgi:ribonuclease HI